MPSRRLRVGIVGAGHLGSLHAEKYAAHPHAQVAAVYDLVVERATGLARRVGARVAESLDDLLREVEVVSIAVPAAVHTEVGLAAARAGVHMLVEKPLAADKAAAAALASAAATAGVLLQVGHLERFNPVYEEARARVTNPRFIECHRLSPFAGRGVDTDVIFDVMIHDLDIIADLVRRPVERVEAVGVPVLSAHVDIANARIRFEGGCIANVTASRVSFKRERKLRVFQEDAYVSLDFDSRTAVIARRAPQPCAGDPMAAIELAQRSFAQADPLAAEIDAFIESVRGGRPAVVGPETALEALALADRVRAAIELPGDVR